MTKLCPRGKAAAKRKFAVYPSAYANAYASKICAGKIKDPSGVKRKDFKGRKPSAEGGRAGDGPLRERARYGERSRQKVSERKEKVNRMNKAGGGLMEATERLKRQGLKKGGIATGCGKVMSNRRKVTKVF
jgi:hypothetical protein